MKNALKWTILIVVFIIALSGCQIKKFEDLDFSIRMTSEQIRQGSFTGGRLIFSETGINQLEEGMLIPILDMVQGFVPIEGTETYEFQTLEEYYGYYYIVESTSDALTLDYLLYDIDGVIVQHEEGIIVTDGDILNRSGEALNNISTRAPHYLLRYSKYNSRNESGSRELEGASLLSFAKERPTEEEQQYFDPEKGYRTTLFRLQRSGTQAYDYTSGVIAAHETEPFLIIESRHFDDTHSDEDFIKIKDPDVPEIEIGDYILDNATSTALVVTGKAASDDPDGFQVFFTNELHIQKVVGAMRIQVEGDLGEMIQRYGSDEQKERLYQLLSERSDYNIWDTKDKVSLWKNDGPVELDLSYDLHLGANMNVTTEVTWDRVSASGNFSIDSKNNLDLIFKLLAVDPGSDKVGKFITVPLKIPIEKFTLGVTLSLVSHYESEQSTSTIHYETDMQTGRCEFGVSYDVGVKLTYIWGFIPVPQAWCNCHEIYEPFSGASFKFTDTKIKELKKNTLKTGLEALFELNLFGAITFNLDANLGIALAVNKKAFQDYDWWADVGVYGSLDNLKFGIGVPFTPIGYQWPLGTIWTLDPESEEGHIVSIPLDNLME